MPNRSTTEAGRSRPGRDTSQGQGLTRWAGRSWLYILCGAWRVRLFNSLSGSTTERTGSGCDRGERPLAAVAGVVETHEMRQTDGPSMPEVPEGPFGFGVRAGLRAPGFLPQVTDDCRDHNEYGRHAQDEQLHDSPLCWVESNQGLWRREDRLGPTESPQRTSMAGTPDAVQAEMGGRGVSTRHRFGGTIKGQSP